MVAKELEMLISAIKQKTEKSIQNSDDTRELEAWLINVISDKTEDDRAKLWASQALGLLKSMSAIVPVFSLLEVNDTRLRSAAIQTLLYINGQAVVDGFVEKLAHEKQMVRFKSAQALAELNNSTAVQPLVTTFDKEPDYEVRGVIAHALGVLEDKRAVETLIKALEDENAHVRIIAALALGDLGDTQAIPYLEKIAATSTSTDSIRRGDFTMYAKHREHKDFDYWERRDLKEAAELAIARIEQKQEQKHG